MLCECIHNSDFFFHFLQLSRFKLINQSIHPFSAIFPGLLSPTPLQFFWREREEFPSVIVLFQDLLPFRHAENTSSRIYHLDPGPQTAPFILDGLSTSQISISHTLSLREAQAPFRWSSFLYTVFLLVDTHSHIATNRNIIWVIPKISITLRLGHIENFN